MDDEVQKILKYLRLWGLLARWDELLAEATRGRFSHERLLKSRRAGTPGRILQQERPCADTAAQTGSHPRTAGDRDVPVHPAAQAGPHANHVAF